MIRKHLYKLLLLFSLILLFIIDSGFWVIIFSFLFIISLRKILLDKNTYQAIDTDKVEKPIALISRIVLGAIVITILSLTLKETYSDKYYLVLEDLPEEYISVGLTKKTLAQKINYYIQNFEKDYAGFRNVEESPSGIKGIKVEMFGSSIYIDDVVLSVRKLLNRDKTIRIELSKSSDGKFIYQGYYTEGKKTKKLTNLNNSGIKPDGKYNFQMKINNNLDKNNFLAKKIAASIVLFKCPEKIYYSQIDNEDFYNVSLSVEDGFQSIEERISYNGSKGLTYLHQGRLKLAQPYLNACRNEFEKHRNNIPTNVIEEFLEGLATIYLLNNKKEELDLLTKQYSRLDFSERIVAKLDYLEGNFEALHNYGDRIINEWTNSKFEEVLDDSDDNSLLSDYQLINNLLSLYFYQSDSERYSKLILKLALSSRDKDGIEYGGEILDRAFEKYMYTVSGKINEDFIKYYNEYNNTDERYENNGTLLQKPIQKIIFSYTWYDYSQEPLYSDDNIECYQTNTSLKKYEWSLNRRKLTQIYPNSLVAKVAYAEVGNYNPYIFNKIVSMLKNDEGYAIALNYANNIKKECPQKTEALMNEYYTRVLLNGRELGVYYRMWKRENYLKEMINCPNSDYENINPFKAGLNTQIEAVNNNYNQSIKNIRELIQWIDLEDDIFYGLDGVFGIKEAFSFQILSFALFEHLYSYKNIENNNPDLDLIEKKLSELYLQTNNIDFLVLKQVINVMLEKEYIYSINTDASSKIDLEKEIDYTVKLTNILIKLDMLFEAQEVLNAQKDSVICYKNKFNLTCLALELKTKALFYVGATDKKFLNNVSQLKTNSNLNNDSDILYNAYLNLLEDSYYYKTQKECDYQLYEDKLSGLLMVYKYEFKPIGRQLPNWIYQEKEQDVLLRNLWRDITFD